MINKYILQKKTDKSIVVKVNKVCQRLTVSTNFDYMLQ